MAEYSVLWTDAARQDLEEIVSFIAIDSVESALSILARLENRCARLRQFPQRGRIVPELKAAEILSYREIVEAPWRIVYRYERNRVFVMAVLDARRDLAGLLLERLTR